MNAAIVMTTLSGPSELARDLVAERLAACVQEVAIGSTYRWQDEIQSEPETLLLIKTAADRVDAVTGYLAQHHPYDVPEIVVIDEAEARGSYLDWLVAATR